MVYSGRYVSVCKMDDGQVQMQYGPGDLILSKEDWKAVVVGVGGERCAASGVRYRSPQTAYRKPLIMSFAHIYIHIDFVVPYYLTIFALILTVYCILLQ